MDEKISPKMKPMAILMLVREIVRWSMVLGFSDGVNDEQAGRGQSLIKDTLNLRVGQSDSVKAFVQYPSPLMNSA